MTSKGTAMAQDSKLLVLARGSDTAGACLRAGFQTEPYGPGSPWLLLADAESSTEKAAQALSRSVRTTTVWWSIHTVVDQIWIKCFEEGAEVREVRYSAEEGWARNTGVARAFESPALTAWVGRRGVRASPDGYDVLDSFIGTNRPPPALFVEPDSNAAFSLPAPMVTEAASIAERRKVPLSLVLHAAWELAKSDLNARLSSSSDGSTEDGDAPPVRLAPPAVPPGFEGPAAIELRPVPTSDQRVQCRLRLPPAVVEELRSMVMAFDRSASWLLTEAYGMARGRMPL